MREEGTGTTRHLRLLYLNHNVIGSGTWQRASNFARALAARGHQVTLVTTSRRNRFRVAVDHLHGVQVVEAPDLWWGGARAGWDPWNALRRTLHLRRLEPDLVHAFDGRPVVSLPGLAVARRARVPLVMDWADWWGRGGRIQERSGWAVRTFFGPVETWFEEAFRPQARAHTVISASLLDRAAALGLKREHILRIPNGCDTDGIRALDRSASRGALGIPAALPLLVHLGTLTRVEMGFLVAALRRVRARFGSAQVVLLGRPVAAVPPELVHDGTIRVTGFVTTAEMNQWLAAADACLVVMPDTVGNRGRWPGKINDYFSAGRATVMPEVGDAAVLLRERGLGWVTGADPVQFANGICTALAEPVAAAVAGERARRLAETELAWSVLAERMERFYYSALGAAVQAPGKSLPR